MSVTLNLRRVKQGIEDGVKGARDLANGQLAVSNLPPVLGPSHLTIKVNGKPFEVAPEQQQTDSVFARGAFGYSKAPEPNNGPTPNNTPTPGQ